MVIQPIKWQNDKLILIDQRVLPNKEEYLEFENLDSVANAIKTMVVRGAPAIGVTAAYGLVLAIKGLDFNKNINIEFNNACRVLSATRPTAVNLFWAIKRMKNKFNTLIETENKHSIYKCLLKEAHSIYNEDIDINKKMGANGSLVIKNNANILTHCNAGALATAGYGTALGVIRKAHEEAKNIHVFVDETRPVMQGSRLTYWELLKEDIPATLITDSMAASLMAKKKIDVILVGADRVALNGDVANKIGTYSLAVLAKFHGVDFYVVAPFSTFDLTLKTGKDIPIEERDPMEFAFNGFKAFPENAKIYNPAFDVTPAELIKGIITEKGIFKYPYEEIKESARG